MKRTIAGIVLACTAFGGFTQEAPRANNAITNTIQDEYVEAGDTLQIAIPLTGLFAAWLHDDAQGAKQLLLSVGASQAIVQTTKHVVSRRRPNDSSSMSFPSGHAAAAFSGAAFLQSRYGAAWGVPAYAAASYVALSRMHGNRHHADDVLAAGSISFLVNQYLISPLNSEDMMMMAMPTRDGFALGMSFTNDFFVKQSKQAYQVRTSKNLKHRFEFDIGVNLEDSLAKAGLPGDQLVDEHQPFAAVNYTYQLSDDKELEVAFSPNETRRRGIAKNDFSYQGANYNKGEGIYLAFRQWSLGANYYHKMQLSDDLQVSAGVGMTAYLLDLETDLENGGKHARNSDVKALPGVVAKVDYEIADDLHLVAKVQHKQWQSDRVSDVEAGVRYDLNREWDIGIAYQTQKADWKSKSLVYDTQTVAFTIANRF
ncbi:phosphatase PAP2 family protein [Vibrio amylolyticus]|uniref:phosphatase PAP2 family protein n=1 Tax=Vibrio amylolyticus TaxID=2847292 RepID=UPI00354DACB4